MGRGTGIRPAGEDVPWLIVSARERIRVGLSLTKNGALALNFGNC